MLILNARYERDAALKRDNTIEEICAEAVALCNQMAIGLDLDIEGQTLCVRAGNHPYNLVQAYEREKANSS
ncbi:hypothetical protein AX777_17735 [Sphingobium yanoikuyae]|uniref:Uncharacterized protein n=1 Tax=Sphingobium yanoikuyae TaxID=13690 RepID=A0A177JWM3_SPHYA|nr:hypothetical protein [Sphingobium yanoikuyae]OAH45448.1 hypothetical protein AX777_17735 [Sphingobium yanoikuyae]